MGNSHKKPITNPNPKVSSMTGTRTPSLSLKMNRRVGHATSLQHILKDTLSEWSYINLQQNNISMDFIQFGPTDVVKNARMKLIWDKIKKKTRVHRWKGIKSSKVTIYGFNPMTDPGVKAVAKGITQSFPELNRLLLSFPYLDISENGVDFMSMLIAKEMRFLKALAIDFKKCSGNSYMRMMKEFSQHLFDLNELSLSMSHEGFAQTIIYIISKRFTKLKTLDLNLANCPSIIGGSLSRIGTYLIQNNLDLHSLTLSLHIPRGMEGDYERLISKVTSSSANFKYLTIDFSNSERMSENIIRKLAWNISNHLQELLKLHLNFTKCNGITDESVQILAYEMIPRLTSLQELKLNFSLNNDITDRSIEALISMNYNEFPCLQKIIFDFDECENITKKGFQAIQSNLKKNFGHLKQFQLCLSPYPEIEEEWDILNKEFQSISGFELNKGERFFGQTLKGFPI